MEAFPQKDDKVANLENEVQTRIQRIGALRARISSLTSEEKQLQTEYDAVAGRITSLRKRAEELAQMKLQETALAADVKNREEKQRTLESELAALQEARRTAVARIASLRAQVSNEESGAEKEKAEAARLEKILSDNAARKEKIRTDTEFCRRSETELAALEEQYKQIAENMPLLRKKYEQTKRLVEEMRANSDPVAQSILEIWSKLPPDVLDKRLVVPSRTNPEKG